MRITGGSLRGRSLHVPAGSHVRPTSERVRETLFNILSHGDLGKDWRGLSGVWVLDVFAGCGALGIEALSRGAAHADFIESDTRTRRYLQRNLAALAVTDRSTINGFDATRPRPPVGPACGLAFLDPPYQGDLAARALPPLIERGWLAPDAIIVLEQADREPPIGAGLQLLQTRTYGRTTLLFMAHASEASTRPPGSARPGGRESSSGR